MKIVIQCAATKKAEAGHFRASDGTPIKFVAHPEAAPSDDNYVYARPDDRAEGGSTTWRNLVMRYNKENNDNEKNPFGLVPAYQLYKNQVYGLLVEKYGIDNVLILSAGWGLMRADFLTPQYDITFKQGVDAFKKRRARDEYLDFYHLQDTPDDQIIFFGGMDYLPLFCKLTAGMRSERIIFYNSKTIPAVPGCRLVRYKTNQRTNWQYSCAEKFMKGKINGNGY